MLFEVILLERDVSDNLAMHTHMYALALLHKLQLSADARAI